MMWSCWRESTTGYRYCTIQHGTDLESLRSLQRDIRCAANAQGREGRERVEEPSGECCSARKCNTVQYGTVHHGTAGAAQHVQLWKPLRLQTAEAEAQACTLL